MYWVGGNEYQLEDDPTISLNLTIGICMYQKNILPYFIILYVLTPSFFPFKPSRTDGQIISTPPVT